MTETQFQYDAGIESVGLRLADRGSDDFRLSVIDDLELEVLDEGYVSVFQSWQELRGMWLASKASLDAAQQNLAAVEAEIRKGTQPDAYKASSAGERKARFDDIVKANPDYQEAMKRLLTSQWDKTTIETDIENAEKELSHIKTRLNWRTFVLRFLGTVKPVSSQQMGL